jgi:hypothetical protein
MSKRRDAPPWTREEFEKLLTEAEAQGLANLEACLAAIAAVANMATKCASELIAARDEWHARMAQRKVNDE